MFTLQKNSHSADIQAIGQSVSLHTDPVAC